MRISITGKICFILLIIFSSVLISSTLYQAYRERQLVLQIGIEHVSSLLQSYKNGLDFIARNHHPDQLAIYQQTIQKQENVQRAKWIQAEKNELFTTVNASNFPSDQLEKQALQGQTIQQILTKNGKTTVVSIQPYYRPDSQDIDAKPVAAIRLEYALDKQLDLVEQHILISAIMLSVIFSAILLMTLALIRKQIVLPLQQLRQAIDDVADFNDLSTRLPVAHNDEIDQLNDSFNQLMERLATTPGNHRLAETGYSPPGNLPPSS